MVGLVPEQNPVKPQLCALEHLSVYATSYRYTTPTGRIPDDPPPEMVEATVQRIEGALLEVARRFGVDLDVADQPAASAAPIR
jgi:hypothetical protein